MHRAVKAKAAQEGLTVSDVIRFLLRVWLSSEQDVILDEAIEERVTETFKRRMTDIAEGEEQQGSD